MRFEWRAIPSEWPPGRFDLIILSEMLCFLSTEELHVCAWFCAVSLMPGGTVVLVNGRGPSGGSMTGDTAALTLLQALPEPWHCENAALLPLYRIDVAQRPALDAD